MMKVLFLDRDGTINIDHGYVGSIDRFEFIDGIFELCRQAEAKGYGIIVITNQSGIERGYYTEADYDLVTRYMVEGFAHQGISVLDVFHCPFLKHADRKPHSGMFEKAQQKYSIDMEQSVSLGDKSRDVDAAQGAGVGKNFLFHGDFAEILSAL